ncbi:hypothetical protein PENSPDRAFT_754955 [Peniophora sp. CONT]|nr:hypothetical protein PENSPDRAFT_754955 [Peniophora sp. CONT]
MSSSVDDVTSRAQATDQAWGTFVRSRFEAIANNTPPMDREMRLQVLKLEFDALEKYIIYAKQSWNTCIGASSLPAEILAGIFAFAQASWEPCITSPQTGHRRADYGWIYTTHVCNSWRRAAVGAPHLWRDIAIFSLPPQMAKLILRRSLSLSLNVFIHRPRVNSDAYSFTRTIDRLEPSIPGDWLCEPILPRIESLSIHTHGDEVERCVRALETPLPTLRALAIDVSWNRSFVCRLDEGILGDQCPPLLSRLSLKNCILPERSSRILSNALTYLSIAMTTHVEYYNPRWMPMSLFRSQLALMPNLEELRLSNALPRHHDTDTTESTLIFPPTFRKLYVECSNKHMRLFSTCYGTFWARSQFPDTASIVSVILEEDYTTTIWGAIAPLIDINPSGPPPVEVCISEDSLSVYFVERPRAEWIQHYTEAKLSADQASIWMEDVNEGRHLCVSSAPNCPDRLLVAFAPVRAINFSLRAIESFGGVGYGPTGRWLSRFGVTRLVSRISVSYIACKTLFEVLGQRDAETGAPQLFPLLEVIVLYTSPVPDRYKSLYKDPDGALLDMLELRRDIGVPVKELPVAREMANLPVWQNVGEGTVVTFYD